MIEVILLVIKMIGITLLVVLGLILFVLALVLFMPICYRIRVTHHPEQTQVTGRISFLFPLFAATFQYIKKISYKVKILFLTVLDSEKPKKEKKTRKRKKASKGKKKSKDGGTVEQKSDETDLRILQGQEKEEKPEKHEEDAPEYAKGEDDAQELPDSLKQEQGEESDTEKKPSLGFLKKISLKLQKIRETITKIITKIKKLLHQKNEIQRILGKPESKQAIAFVWSKVKRLFKNILPRKIKGYLHYGAADPATTGKVTGIISVLYAKTGCLLEFQPNFEEEELACDVELRGQVQTFTLLMIALKVVLNKELRQLILDFKQIKDIE